MIKVHSNWPSLASLHVRRLDRHVKLREFSWFPPHQYFPFCEMTEVTVPHFDRMEINRTPAVPHGSPHFSVIAESAIEFHEFQTPHPASPVKTLSKNEIRNIPRSQIADLWPPAVRAKLHLIYNLYASNRSTDELCGQRNPFRWAFFLFASVTVYNFTLANRATDLFR